MAQITGTTGSDTITGTPEDDIIYGGGGFGRDTIYGLAGNDYIDPESEGSGGAIMYGGPGNDTYIAHWAFQRNMGISTDAVIEYAGEGFDTVKVLRSWILGGDSEVEWIEPVNLFGTSIGYIQGSSIGQTIIGDARANEIYGLGGDDILIGGLGADTMVGGSGNDTFYVDNAGDHALDDDGLFDRVYSSVSYALDGNTAIEFLAVESESGTAALTLIGNAFAQTIRGNAGANILYGGGGNDVVFGLAGNDILLGEGGADTLHGGTGDDTYYITDAQDIVIEHAGEGNDRVAVTTSHFLSATSSVELLEAANLTSSDHLDLGGSDTNNHIHGNEGLNFLYGKGGGDLLYGYGGDDFLVGGDVGKTDSDTMSGGAGNDTYYVFASSDVIIELPGEGVDRVATKVSFTLDPAAEVERLEAGASTSLDALTLVGSNSGNAIIGNGGANVLDGRGGGDLLSGLAGNDVFRFSSVLGAGNVDSIHDFRAGEDKIGLDDAIFGRFNPGSLDPAYFKTGLTGQGSDDYVLYDQTTGALYYDADGSDAGSPVQFASILGAPALTATDFVIV